MRKKAIIFILITVGVLYGLNFAYDYLIRKNDFNKVWWLSHIKNKDYDFAFLGNSRVYTMVHTDTLEKKWNKKGIDIALDGSNLPQQYLMLYLFLKNGNHIKDLYFNIDFSELRIKQNSDMRVWCFLPFINDNEVYTTLRKNYGEKTISWRYIPFYKYVEYNSKIGLLTIANSVLKIEKKPFNNAGDFAHISNRSGKLSNKDKKDSMVAFAPNLESFEKILSLCKEHNIKIHVYTAPIWKGLVKNLVNRQEFINANIAPLINKYRASYVDQTANPISENAAYFADDTHLNTEGLKDWMKFLEQMEH